MRVKRSPTRHVKTQTCTHGLPFWRFTSHPLYFVCRRLTPVSCMRQSWQHALLVQLRRSGKYKIVDNNKYQVVPGAQVQQMPTQIYLFDISNIFKYMHTCNNQIFHPNLHISSKLSSLNSPCSACFNGIDGKKSGAGQRRRSQGVKGDFLAAIEQHQPTHSV